ncbi:MAG TPA: hypothetical protein VJN43_19265 [Bryobacteraceae bacterium]|nr:hypothetical protein [Bryobacteraceae bacterium]
MLTLTAYDTFMEQLFQVMKRFTDALSQAGIEYRIIGGMAVFLHVRDRQPMAARLTNDVDVAVRRTDLQAIVRAVEPFGFKHRHAAGVDMLVDKAAPTARSAVHLVFAEEKVRKEYLEPVPGFSPPAKTVEGALVAPVADLVRMKLTSFRLKDRVHIQDLDSVHLITPEIEAGLPEILRSRLAEIRSTE